jgi:hypothetical protein
MGRLAGKVRFPFPRFCSRYHILQPHRVGPITDDGEQSQTATTSTRSTTTTRKTGRALLSLSRLLVSRQPRAGAVLSKLADCDGDDVSPPTKSPLEHVSPEQYGTLRIRLRPRPDSSSSSLTGPNSHGSWSSATVEQFKEFPGSPPSPTLVKPPIATYRGRLPAVKDSLGAKTPILVTCGTVSNVKESVPGQGFVPEDG